MSTSNSADKNLLNLPESNLPKRNIIGLDRFNLSDEELHNIRIHAAVYKYNNFRSNCIRRMGDRRSQLLPFKRKLLKSSTKNKACDDNLEEARSLKRSCNRYQGVGNFPTVHLNKTPVVCKPIKRHTSNELKIQYPELPMNRFVSHTSEPNSELKANTRSVLDVLQDLSRKRIHSKDETDNSAVKSKGLGGDTPLDIDAPYKPLFVQKPKNNVVLTKDSTTQTLDAATILEPANPINNANNSTPNTADPKAELRRKLARQNNEIFASLSSSIFSPFSIKRKLDKTLQTPENGQHRDDPLKKRPRLATKDFNIKLVFDKSRSKSNNSVNKISNGNKPDKMVEKPKVMETSPKLSPSKDRMMNIYLDMQNGNPKAQIFQRSSVDENERESLLENESPSLLSPNSAKKCVSFNEEVTVLTFDKVSQDENSGFSKVKKDHSRKKKDSQKDNQSLEETSDLNTGSVAVMPEFSKDSTQKESENLVSPSSSFRKPEVEDVNNPEVKKSDSSIVNSPAGLNFSTSSVPNFNSGTALMSSMSPNFNISSTTTVSSPLAENPIFSTKIPTSPDTPNADNKLGSNQEKPINSLNFRNSSVKAKEEGNSFNTTNFSTFKFGSSTNTLSTPSTADSLASSNSITTIQVSNKEALLISTPNSSQSVSSTLNANASFFGLNQQPSTATSSSPPTFSSSLFGQVSKSSESKPQVTGVSGAKPQFSFGPSISSVTSSATNIDPKSPVFSFGQSHPNLSVPKISASTPAEIKITQQGGTNSGGSSFNQKAPIFSFGSKLDSQNVATGNQNLSQNNAFGSTSSAFGQTSVTTQTETLVQNSVSNSSTFGQGIRTQSHSFLSSNSQSSAFGQSTPTSTFSFGQKPAGQDVSSNVKTDLFGAKQQPNFSFAFGQKPPNQETSSSNQAVNAEKSAFAANPQTNLFAFGQKPPETNAPSQNNLTPGNTFSQNSQMQSTAFGQSSNAASVSLTPALSQPSAFGQPTGSQTGNSLNQNSNQAVAPFGQPSTTQSSTSFGQIATDQTSSVFGQAKPQPLSLGQTTQPGFGQSSAPLFGAKTSAFGPPAVSASTSASFGSATQSTPFPQQPFGQNAAKSSNAFGPSAGGFFNETPATQAQASLFGQPNTANAPFGTSVFGQSSQENAFGQNSNAPSTPFGQSTATPAQPFGQSSQFSFGSSIPSSTSSFATAPPNTTASVYGFNASTPSASSQSSTFNFGQTSTPSTGSTQSPFSFGNQTSEPFKFGANQNKETPSFGGSTSGSTPSPFGFGPQSNNNVGAADPNAKPAASLFNFGAGSSTTSSAPGFNFGVNPSPPVFSFGGSGSSGSSNSTFSFGGTPQPGGPMFGQGATPSPSGAFPIPGTFSIGSGSSQSRPRAAARHRRRP